MSKNKTSRLQKIKTKIKENPDEIALYSFIGLMVTAVAAATVYAVVEENRQTRETNEWIKKENAAGNSVFMLIDGSYLSVPTPQYVNQI